MARTMTREKMWAECVTPNEEVFTMCNIYYEKGREDTINMLINIYNKNPDISTYDLIYLLKHKQENDVKPIKSNQYEDLCIGY